MSVAAGVSEVRVSVAVIAVQHNRRYTVVVCQ